MRSTPMICLALCLMATSVRAQDTMDTTSLTYDAENNLIVAKAPYHDTGNRQTQKLTDDTNTAEERSLTFSDAGITFGSPNTEVEESYQADIAFDRLTISSSERSMPFWLYAQMKF